MSSTNSMTSPAFIANKGMTTGSSSGRMIAVIRCILAFSGLVIVHVDASQPTLFSELSYKSLVAYCILSVVLAIMAFRRDAAALPPRQCHWVDMLFCAYLVTLTHGTNSLFFSFYLFAILSASFTRGFMEGLLVTGTSVMLFVLASIWFETPAQLGFDQILLRPIYLLALGYMASFWGGHELTQRRRMNMLQEVNSQMNPRVGFDYAIRVNLDRILNFSDAKTCMLVLKRPTTPPTYLSYFTSQQQAGQAEQTGLIPANAIHPATVNPNSINEDIAKTLLKLPASFATCYGYAPVWWKRYLPCACQVPNDESLSEECRALANLLDTQCFLTVPYTQQDGTTGRIFLTPNKCSFSQSDIDFVKQLVNSVSRVVESLQLMDELVAESAKNERFRISLDIHDTTIQPYIGLKLGLDALNRQAGSDNPLSKEISELLNKTEATINDLRSYVTTLREDREQKVQAVDSFIASIKEQADRFKRFYGIDVKVIYDAKLQVNSRLAGEALQIIAEGLSNILRHTHAKHAYISINCDEQILLLKIANESAEVCQCTPDFIPRSINARALSLGGSSFVNCDAQGYTVVHISIPL